MEDNATHKYKAILMPPTGKSYWFSGSSEKISSPSRDSAAIFAPDFFLKDSKPWVRFQEVQVQDSMDLARNKTKKIQAQKLIKFQKAEFEKFASDFDRIQTAISEAKIEKAVPISFDVSPMPLDFFEQVLPGIFDSICANLKKRAAYLLNLESSGFIGLSPELFLDWNIHGGTLTSCALAGTAPIHEAGRLLEDVKERKEHQLVIDQVAATLEKFGEVIVGKTEVLELGTLAHLKTPITCRLQNKSVDPSQILEWVKALHPTPALGIKSDKVDFAWLEDLHDQDRRGRFGTPFGVWDPNYGAKFFVAIRNMQWTSEELFLGAGCGIIKESNLKKEWQELELKKQSVLKLMGFGDSL